MKKEATYGVVLVSTILIGHLVRKLKCSEHRKYVSSLLGLLVVVVVSGQHVYYSIVIVFINYLVIKFINNRYCCWASFPLCFLYMIFFRTCSYFHFYSPPDTNAVQMILTLKMIGLALEIQTASLSNSTDGQTAIYLKKKPSLLDMYHYAFCYAGILTGPYYKYTTYMDAMHCPYEHAVSYTTALLDRFKYCLIYFPLYAGSAYLFPLAGFADEAILNETFAYKVWYMMANFFTFRMKMYLGFVLGECVCIMAGIGGYPTLSDPCSGGGPQERQKFNTWKKDEDNYEVTEYNFVTICNVNEFKCEFARNLKDAIRNWNMTVQYWLVIVVYQQCPIKVLKLPLTMLTSAVWHGTNPGYYLSLLTIPFVLLAQRELETAVRVELSASAKLIYDWLSWATTMVIFGYIIIPFLLLDVWSAYFYWQSIYFFGHILIVAIYIFGYLIKCFAKAKSKKL